MKKITRLIAVLFFFFLNSQSSFATFLYDNGKKCASLSPIPVTYNAAGSVKTIKFEYNEGISVPGSQNCVANPSGAMTVPGTRIIGKTGESYGQFQQIFVIETLLKIDPAKFGAPVTDQTPADEKSKMFEWYKKGLITTEVVKMDLLTLLVVSATFEKVLEFDAVYLPELSGTCFFKGDLFTGINAMLSHVLKAQLEEKRLEIDEQHIELVNESGTIVDPCEYVTQVNDDYSFYQVKKDETSSPFEPFLIALSDAMARFNLDDIIDSLEKPFKIELSAYYEDQRPLLEFLKLIKPGETPAADQQYPSVYFLVTPQKKSAEQK